MIRNMFSHGWKRKAGRIAAAAALVAGLGLIIFFGFTGRFPLLNPGDARAVAPQAGSLAPDFELKTLSGQSVHLKDLRGHPVLINFWATWCTPCIQEMPMIETRYQKYSPDLVVLGVNYGEPESDVRSFVKTSGVTFDILLDNGQKIQELYRVRGYPTTFVVDSSGRVRAVQLGVMSESQLDGFLKKVGVGG